MWRSLLLAALLPAATAQAGCPTRADLAQGVVLVQNTPVFLRSDFETGPDGIVEARADRLQGALQQSSRFYAHGMLDITDVAYDGDAAALDALPETGHLLLTGQLRRSARPVPVAFEATYLGTGARALAECRYDTWQVRTQMLFPDRTGPAFLVEYAPTLGLVLAVSEIDPAGMPMPLLTYQWAGTAADVRR